jgi:hypothetical protein
LKPSPLHAAAHDTRIGEHVPFDVRSVARAPAAPGVYLLYRGHRLIYIGVAAGGASIRGCLRQHLGGERGPCTSLATEFDYEASAVPLPLYRHYVGVYLHATGGLLPDCNAADEG